MFTRFSLSIGIITESYTSDMSKNIATVDLLVVKQYVYQWSKFLSCPYLLLTFRNPYKILDNKVFFFTSFRYF